MNSQETGTVIRKVNQALQSIRVVAKIDTREQTFPHDYKYDYTPEQATAIIKSLRKEIDLAEKRLMMRFKKPEEPFKF